MPRTRRGWTDVTVDERERAREEDRRRPRSSAVGDIGRQALSRCQNSIAGPSVALSGRIVIGSAEVSGASGSDSAGRRRIDTGRETRFGVRKDQGVGRRAQLPARPSMRPRANAEIRLNHMNVRATVAARTAKNQQAADLSGEQSDGAGFGAVIYTDFT